RTKQYTSKRSEAIDSPLLYVPDQGPKEFRTRCRIRQIYAKPYSSSHKNSTQNSKVKNWDRTGCAPLAIQGDFAGFRRGAALPLIHRSRPPKPPKENIR